MDLVELKAQGNVKNSKRHPWEQARSVFVANQIQKKYKSSDKMIILDIGCGDTYVAETLLQKFPNSEFYCADTAFTPELIVRYKEKYNDLSINIYTDMHKAVEDIEGDIDFVLLLDVVEHAKDDVSFLNEIYNADHVTKKTNIFITVPAFQVLFNNHDVLLGHHRRYTNHNLRVALQSAGFSSQGLGYFFTSLLLPRALEKVLEKGFGVKSENTALSVWDKNEVVTNFIREVLVLDTKITGLLEKMGIKMIGLSNYAIGKKI